MKIIFEANDWRKVLEHLQREQAFLEEAAFAYGHFDSKQETFRVVEIRLLSGNDLAIQTPYHIEVSEAVQAQVIKRAHDLGASLIELHSHIEDPLPRFSESDWCGFGEFVPHVWFRLKQRPYAAVVFGPNGVDALAWVEGSKAPVQIHAVGTDDGLEPCSGTSLPGRWGGNEIERNV